MGYIDELAKVESKEPLCLENKFLTAAVNKDNTISSIKYCIYNHEIGYVCPYLRIVEKKQLCVYYNKK